VRVAVEPAEGGGVEEAEVTFDERGEGGFVAGLGVATEEGCVIGHGGVIPG